jgi:hypothetical protein
MMMKSASAVVRLSGPKISGVRGSNTVGQDWVTTFNLVGDAQFTDMPGSGQQYHHPVRVLLQMIDRVNGHGRVSHQLGLTKADKIHTAVSMGTKGAADKIPVLAGHVAGPPIQFLLLRFRQCRKSLLGYLPGDAPGNIQAHHGDFHVPGVDENFAVKGPGKIPVVQIDPFKTMRLPFSVFVACVPEMGFRVSRSKKVQRPGLAGPAAAACQKNDHERQQGYDETMMKGDPADG